MKLLRHIPAAILMLAAIISCTNDVPLEAVSVTIEPGDTPEQVAAKAALVRPSSRQLAALDDEFIAFIHFGPNTFTEREWGTGVEDPAVFDLKHLDTDQWCRVMKDAGIRKVVLTVKHHDGFVLYQTRYTKHGIMSTGFEDGKGDVLRSLSESCRKYGLKLGVYLSPADLRQMEDDGLYGNGSQTTLRTIPKQVEGRPFADRRTFQYEADDYNEYFLSQLFELLTEYGPISELWFDGAHPKHKGGQQYNQAAWTELIRTLAPEAVMFNVEDIRWCGNEAGDTRENEWNVLPFNENGGLIPGIDAEDMGSREFLAGLQAPYTLKYFPAETDVSIRHGWFYRNDDEQSVRSADNVFDMYERTVGGNTIFMLNIPPTREGVLGERDVKTLEEVGRRIRDTYGTNLCKRSLKKPAAVGDGLEMKLKGKQLVNRVVIAEPVGETGERIEKYAVEAFQDGTWKEVAVGGNVGHKRIVRFASVLTDRIRVRITESRAEAILSICSAHYYKERPVSFSISHHPDGTVSIDPQNNVFRTGKSTVSSVNSSNEVHYTTDGSDPDVSSPIYEGPFKFENGTVRAVSVVNGEYGEISSRKIGYDRSSWKMTINPYNTLIDCGKTIEMTAFNFIPNRNNFHGDYVSKGTMSVSPDGRKWSKVAEFEFGNIVNDPSVRHIDISAPVKGRYIRLDVLELVGDGDGFQSVDSDIEVL